MRWLLVLSFTSAHAFARLSEPIVDIGSMARALEAAKSHALAALLKHGVEFQFQAALLKSAFPGDRSEIDREYAGQEKSYRVRAFAREPGGGYSVTAPNGRAFRLAAGPGPNDLRVNDRVLHLTGTSLRGFSAGYAKALRETFVVRHLPVLLLTINRAEAYVQGLLSAVVIGLLVLYSDWASGDVPTTVTKGFVGLARTCEAERAAGKSFADSATNTAYRELIAKEVALGVADEDCAHKIETTAVEFGKASLHLDETQRRAICEARRGFLACVRAFRSADAPSPTVELIEKSTPSFN